ncbi:MAG: DUF4442 domain-containing protein [Asticcacaulis sp.]
MPQPDLRRFNRINWYPPLIGAGIRVIEASPDYTSVTVEMKLRWWNRNIVGTQFGGSLYMMCDPFFMAILMHNLGPDYIVWDKAASIQFLKPKRGHVQAHFHIPPEEIARVRHEADTQRKSEPEYEVDITGPDGESIARVRKVLYVRRKEAKSGA